MRIEVLLSCMDESDEFSYRKRSNVTTDLLIINQCGTNGYKERVSGGRKTRVFCSDQRGLSKSRNYALNQAYGDICLICDDDVRYVDNYDDIVSSAFRALPRADVIVFQTEMVNTTQTRKNVKRVRKAPWFKSYGSVRIAFRLSSVQNAGVCFNSHFGSGSTYSAAEDSLWLRDIRRKGLSVYECPTTIAVVDYSQSTWFKGYDAKFFYDKGAFVAAAYPAMSRFLKFYFVYRFFRCTDMSCIEMVRWLNRGIAGYGRLLSYEEFCRKSKCL